MSLESSLVSCLLIGITVITLFPGFKSEVKVEFHGSIDIPSWKCAFSPQKTKLDVKNKTICFCVFIPLHQSGISFPFWSCMHADTDANWEDLKLLEGAFKNASSLLPTFPKKPGVNEVATEKSPEKDKVTDNLALDPNLPIEITTQISESMAEVMVESTTTAPRAPRQRPKEKKEKTVKNFET